MLPVVNMCCCPPLVENRTTSQDRRLFWGGRTDVFLQSDFEKSQDHFKCWELISECSVSPFICKATLGQGATSELLEEDELCRAKGCTKARMCH